MRKGFMKKDITSAAVDDHNKFKYQVAAFISGESKADVVEQLEDMIREIKLTRGDAGRPMQGIALGGKYVREIIRPKWGEFVCE
jgi:hypothetical protein